MLVNRTHPISGFTLVELAIVLAIVGMLMVGLWRIISQGNDNQLAQTAANQHAQLLSSVKAFLASSDGQVFLKDGGSWVASTSKVLPLPDTAPDGSSNSGCMGSSDTAGLRGQAVTLGYSGGSGGVAASISKLCNFLPAGFTLATTNPYGEKYSIYVLRDGTLASATIPPATYSFMILADSNTAGATAVPDIAGGNIASQIGADGGFVFANTDVCTASAATRVLTACGSNNSWNALVTGTGSYGFPAATTYAGSIASRTFVSPEQDNKYPWLARFQMPSDPTFAQNTMSTNLYMGSIGTSSVLSNINMFPYTPTGTVPSGSAINFSGVNYTVTLGSTGPTLTPNTVGASLKGNSIVDMGTSGTFIFTDGNNQGIIMKHVDVNAPTSYTENAVLTVEADCSTWFGASNYNASCTDKALQINGDLYITGLIHSPVSLYYNPTGSDLRLKTNIHPIANPLEAILDLKPVTFTLKSNKQKSMGFIAQDLEKIYPDLVTERDGYKAVYYEGIIAPLVGAVQELKKENDQLRIRQDQLQKELDEQKASRH